MKVVDNILDGKYFASSQPDGAAEGIDGSYGNASIANPAYRTKTAYPCLAFYIRLWKWLDMDISHLWKRDKAVVVISPRGGYTRILA